MILKKGITRKTFLFTFLLIVLVLALSFSILYFVMPGYYLRMKSDTLNANADDLAQSLQAAASEDECAAQISKFVVKNNATVLAFDSGGLVIPALSTPLVSMNRENYSFFYVSEDLEAADALNHTIGIQLKLKPDEGPAKSEDKGIYVSFTNKLAGQAAIIENKSVGSQWIDHMTLSSTLQPIDEAKSVILSLLPYLLLLSVAAGLVLAYLYARQLTKPILAISNAAVQMQHMEPDVVSGIRSDDELGQLSQNMDALYEKLRNNIQSLQAETDKANRLERSKTEFLQSTGHELKTPIAALNGVMEGMIDNVGVYKDKEKYLRESKLLIDKLSRLVSEILNASKADLPDAELEFSEIGLGDLIGNALDTQALFIEEKQLTAARGNLAFSVVNDSSLLYQALHNLIANAVRYTPPRGYIHINARRANNSLTLEIENQCQNIPEEELYKLFEPFYTRSYSRDKTKSGTGLGLYIVKKNLDRLGIPFEIQNTALGLKFSLFFETAESQGPAF